MRPCMYTFTCSIYLFTYLLFYLLLCPYTHIFLRWIFYLSEIVPQMDAIQETADGKAVVYREMTQNEIATAISSIDSADEAKFDLIKRYLINQALYIYNVILRFKFSKASSLPRQRSHRYRLGRREELHQQNNQYVCTRKSEFDPKLKVR